MTSSRAERADYWEHRYASGGKSGYGSTRAVWDWKWGIIRRYVGDPAEVLDVGCGDVSFWEGHECASYLGIDISPSVLVQDRQRRPTWTFIAASAAARLRVRRKVVLCFDFLFHILNDDDYAAILDNLADSAGEWLFLFTWRTNPFESPWVRLRVATLPGEPRRQRVRYLIAHPFRIWKAVLAPAPTTDGYYEKYRPMEASLARLQGRGLTVVAVHPCPYYGGVGAMYVLRRLEEGPQAPGRTPPRTDP